MTRKFTMSPIEPRTAGTLKGFGFTVTWGDEPASHVAAAFGGDGAGASVSTDTQSTAVRMDVHGLSLLAGGSPPPKVVTEPAEEHRVATVTEPTAGTQAPPVDTPKPVNDDFPRIQVIGSIR